ncbi:MAG TPA: type II toxin-antitoxin system mRNA interferase toxin, RelE/StbE family [Campylobacterales bacterium]|nr:type II toxin-antitoxin system mRNA interferase toxin, RelE/StbE family [Campylobacterales bacterium]
MIFDESFHPKFKSDLKKIDKSVVKDIKEKHLDIILQDPMVHEKLKGKLSHLHSYHFQKNSTQYRIAYEVLEDKMIVFHYMVATRENFYKKLGKRV